MTKRRRCRGGGPHSPAWRGARPDAPRSVKLGEAPALEEASTSHGTTRVPARGSMGNAMSPSGDRPRRVLNPDCGLSTVDIPPPDNTPTPRPRCDGLRQWRDGATTPCLRCHVFDLRQFRITCPQTMRSGTSEPGRLPTISHALSPQTIAAGTWPHHAVTPWRMCGRGYRYECTLTGSQPAHNETEAHQRAFQCPPLFIVLCIHVYRFNL